MQPGVELVVVQEHDVIRSVLAPQDIDHGDEHGEEDTLLHTDERHDHEPHEIPGQHDNDPGHGRP